jgi:hypothetical protein
MVRKKKKSKAGKRFRTFLVIFFVLGILFHMGIKFILEPYIKDQISEELNKNPKRLYEIIFDELDMNVFNGSVKIENLSIAPRDTAIVLLENAAIRGLISAQTELIQIKEFNILAFLKTKSMIINRIKVENIMINYLSNPQAKPRVNNTSGNLVHVFPDKINSVNINYFEILTANFTFSEVEKPDEPLFIIDSLSVAIENIRLDSSTLQLPVPLTFTNIDMMSRNISYTPLEFYTISTSGIRFDVQDTSLTIKQFQLIPKYSKEEFNKQIQYNTDWFSISVESIVLKGFNSNEFDAGNAIHLNSIDINKPDIEIYRDKRLPDAPFKHKVLIVGGINKISREFVIDTLKVKNGILAYGEMNDVVGKPGKVFFNPFNLTAYNITNDSATIENKPNLEMDFSGKIMGKSELNAHLSFLLKSTNEYFTAAGELDPIPAAEFNPMVEGLMQGSIISGKVKKAKFSFKATDDVSDGELTLIYENLKVDISKQNDPDKKSGGLSAGANILIRNNNLPEDNKYSTGKIHFERRKDKFIINYLWNSVKTGIISIVVPIADKNKKLGRQEKKEQKQIDKQK